MKSIAYYYDRFRDRNEVHDMRSMHEQPFSASCSHERHACSACSPNALHLDSRYLMQAENFNESMPLGCRHRKNALRRSIRVRNESCNTIVSSELPQQPRP